MALPREATRLPSQTGETVLPENRGRQTISDSLKSYHFPKFEDPHLVAVREPTFQKADFMGSCHSPKLGAPPPAGASNLACPWLGVFHFVIITKVILHPQPFFQIFMCIMHSTSPVVAAVSKKLQLAFSHGRVLPWIHEDD